MNQQVTPQANEIANNLSITAVQEEDWYNYPNELYLRGVSDMATNPELLSAQGLQPINDGWIRVEDSEKFFSDFYDMAVTVLCPIWDRGIKKWSWEMYRTEMDDTGQLYYADGSGDCGVDYTAVSYYRLESFPPLPTEPLLPPAPINK